MVGLSRRSFGRVAKRFIRRRRRAFRGRGKFRRTFVRSARGRRFRVRGRFSKHGRVQKFKCTQVSNASFPFSDSGGGGHWRTFILYGVTDSGTAAENAIGGAPPVGAAPTWGSYWRQPLSWNADTGQFGYTPTGVTLASLQGTYTQAVSGLIIPVQNFCGFSTNMAFRIGELYSAQIIPWATIYKEIRVRRINVKVICPRIVRTDNGLVPISADGSPNASLRPFRPGGSYQRGGDMVFMCTRSTGPVPERQVSTTELNNGSWVQAAGYAFIRRNPRLRKRAQFRNDVAYGMRPVKYSFRPTVAVSRPNYSQLPLLGTLNTNEMQGIMDVPGANLNSRNPTTSMGYKYRTAPWMEMVLPAFTSVSSSANAGITGASSAGNITSTTTTSWNDLTNRWLLTPMFGFYAGLQPGTAQVWPRSMRVAISFDLEFRGFRNQEFAANAGGPPTYYKEWGPLPTVWTTSV